MFSLPADSESAVRESRVFSGGKRHFEKIRRFLPADAQWIEIGGDIEETLRLYDERLKNANAKIVIFASGDPLFYGIGSTLKRLRPDCGLEIFPAPNSVQTLCRKTVIPYENMVTASVHGRDWHELDRALIAGEKLIGLLTDMANSPSAAARRMIEYGFESYRCITGENLGEKDERTGVFSVREMEETEFKQPCVVILERTEKTGRQTADGDFETLEGKPGMISKLPARACAISRLCLRGAEHFWDIGFCTGAVSVEARRGFAALRVTAFEKNRACEKLIEANSKKFSAPGIKVVMGNFFESEPEKLPPPDAVFIGGHGGRLAEMMKIVGKIIPAGGRTAINSVTEKSGKIFRDSADSFGFQMEESTRLPSGTEKGIEILSAVKK